MIEFEHAGFAHGGTAILRELSLSLEAGSFNVLAGPAGAGKTTLIRLGYLDLLPTEGAIRFFGRPIGRRNRNAIADLRRVVGVVHQDCRFLDHLPLIENIALPLSVCGIDARDRAEDLRALLEWVDLTDRVAAHPPELSGDERRRAALARAIILSPAMILADEPTGGLDPAMAHRVLTLLVELNRMGKTVLVATRDPELAATVAARVPVRALGLADGRVTLQ